MLDVIKKTYDPDPVQCGVCHGRLYQVLSPPSLRFKGSGFYVNDYGGKGDK